MFCFRRRASESAARDSVVMDVIPLDLDWIGFGQTNNRQEECKVRRLMIQMLRLV